MKSHGLSPNTLGIITSESCFFKLLILIIMTQENKSRLIKFLWNLASAILAAVGTALGVSCAVS